MLAALAIKLGAYWAANSSKIIMIGVITVITLSILGYGYYKIDQGGYQRATAEWMDRESKIVQDQKKILDKNQREYDAALKKNSNAYLGAWKHYVEINESSKRDLADSLDMRLRVRATCPASSGNKMHSNNGIPQRSVSEGQGSDWAELGEEDSRSIQRTAIEAREMSQICSDALDMMHQAGMIK